MEIKSPAKINLSLVVEEKRKDNFHNIKTIFQTISLFDKIEIFPHETLSIRCPFIKKNENIVYKACIYLSKYIGKKYGARIVIKKHIPIASGLGGGSSNCAETLSALNKLWDLSLSKDELKNIGAFLGKDVPFFFEKGTCLGTGRGEKLEKLPPMPSCFFLLAFFPFPILTKDVYKAFLPNKSSYKIEELISSIKKGDIFDIAKNLHNDLEEIVFKKYPEIKKMKEYLIKEGALGALMTGSGPTIFGIFSSFRDASFVKRKLALAKIRARITKPI